MEIQDDKVDHLHEVCRYWIIIKNKLITYKKYAFDFYYFFLIVISRCNIQIKTIFAIHECLKLPDNMV